MSKWLALFPVLFLAGGITLLAGRGGDAPGPVKDDVLSESYAADRITQIAVLRELASQPFDGATDDGRRKAGEWFNAQRFRNRADDFGGYTDRVAEAIEGNAEDSLANEMEAK